MDCGTLSLGDVAHGRCVAIDFLGLKVNSDIAPMVDLARSDGRKLMRKTLRGTIGIKENKQGRGI